jgi:plastocyanin
MTINYNRHLTMLLLFTAALMFTACEHSGEKTSESHNNAITSMSHEPKNSHESMEAGQHVVEFAALDFVFAGPSEIPSGWTTFRMPNRGEEHHVMILIQLPEGVSYADYHAATNQRGATGSRPDWWGEQVIMGGPAALAPGLTGETTVKLDPGEYAMVCPVPTADGTQHSALGMMRPLTVTEEDSGAPEPEADITMTLRGIEFEMDGVITPGRHTIRVVFEHQPEGKPHDVHVARLGPNQTLEDFTAAMETLDLTDSDFYFIGGAEDMPEGYTAYFTADFEPGRYAFWCHFHSGDGMVQEFRVE